MTSKHDGSPTWGEIYWAWKKRGAPPEEAAFRADEAMRKREKERAAPVSFVRLPKPKNA